jgi:hypothetical protein
MSVQAQYLLQHLPQWPGHGCQDALKAVLGHHHQTLSPGLKSQLQEMLKRISIYEKVIFFFRLYVDFHESQLRLKGSNLV